MANLSNINNKLLVGTNGEVRIGDTATVADVKLRVKQTAQQWTAQFVNTDSSVAYGISIDTSASSYGVAGTLQCYTNSGGGFIVRNDSRVGIGTASPGYTLEIAGPSTTSFAYQRTGVSANKWGFHSDNDATYWQNLTSGGLLFTLQNGGNVGIGTTSPASKLEVYGGTSGTNDVDRYVRFKASNGEKRFDFYMGGTGNASSLGMYTSDGTTKNVQIAAGGNSYFNAGNVGIGTTSPDSKLDVKGPSATPADGNQTLSITNSTGGTQLNLGTAENSYGWIEAREGSTLRNLLINPNGGNVGIGTSSPGEKLEVAGNVGVNGFITHNGDSGTFMGWSANDTNVFYTAGNERLRIDADGNVGIGAASPASILHIKDNSAGPTQLSIQSNDYSRAEEINFLNPSTSAISGQIKYYTNPTVEYMSFSTSNNSAAVERMRIDNSGNVGIGTTSPSGKLNVFGATGLPATSGTTFTGTMRLQVAGYGTTLDFGAEGPSTGKQWIQATDASNLAITYPLLLNPNGGNVGIGTTSPDRELEVEGAGNVYIRVTSRTDNDSTALELKNTRETWTIRNDDTNDDALEFQSDGGTQVTMLKAGNVGIGVTSPDSLLELDGAIGIGGASGDSNVSISTTAFTAQSAGCLHVNWGVAGTAANGSTIVFTYAATAWKSWTLKFNFASTNGMTQGVIGGYNNNNGGGSSVYDINALGCSAVATNSGQTVIVTFTFTALGIHPMMSFVYMQSGGDGQPRADRVSLQANNAV